MTQLVVIHTKDRGSILYSQLGLVIQHRAKTDCPGFSVIRPTGENDWYDAHIVDHIEMINE